MVKRLTTETISYWTDSILYSYSKIFFSESKLLSVFIVASTMVVPLHGLLGLLGALFSNLSAYIIGMDRQAVRRGVYGFNGILTGLGFGFFYEVSFRLIFILLISSLIVTLLTIFLNNIFNAYLGLPAMSMPFNIVTWLVLLASIGFGYLQLSHERWGLLHTNISFFPYWLDIFFRSIGSVLFQINPLSGVIIAAGLLLYSRIAFVLVAIGFIFGVIFHGFLGVSNLLIETQYLGFNYILSALAIGGVFIVPSAGSVFLSIVSVALSMLILVASHSLFPEYLSPLALPFNMAVCLVLYALRLRLYPTLGVHLTSGDVSSPEESLSRYRENIRVWKRYGLNISLPFHGRWIVTQGNNGAYTHKEEWRFAYDFQAVDSNGKLFKGGGEELEDYYSYNLPIIASSSGKVVLVLDGVIDNQIGKVNTANNWGNYIIMENLPGFYSCFAHLKNGSIKVVQGQECQKGEVLASCGNSGRSPYPHLHFQFQLTSKIGAPSVNFEFSNILFSDQKEMSFLPKGKIKENSIVQNIPLSKDFERFFPYAMNKVWSYAFKNNERENVEMWRLDVDFYGNLFIVSSPRASRLYFTLTDGVLTMKKLEGDRNTGLFFFGSLFSEIPFADIDKNINWSSFEDADYFISPFMRSFFDLFALLGIGAKRQLHCTLEGANDEKRVHIKSGLLLKTPVSNFAIGKFPPLKIVFAKDKGVVTAQSGDKLLNLDEREGHC